MHDKNPDEGRRGSAGGSRLAIILSHPVQYYSPWFRHLAAQGEYRVRVFYLWDNSRELRLDPDFQRAITWDVDLLSGYESEFVPNLSPRPGSSHFFGLVNPGLLTRLLRWRPDAVLLYGYNFATHTAVILWSMVTRVPLIFRGDSHRLGREVPSRRTQVVLGRVYATFAAFLAVGAANRRYFEIFGVAPDRIFFAPHAVDASRFRLTPALKSKAAAIRVSLGLDDKTRIVLFAGKFSPGKQPVELLNAFLALRAPNWALVFVGSGVEEAKLRRLAENTADAQVHFLPFANQSEMPVRYALADLFVLPSRGLYETWGLAVNEAMEGGVPALVSDRVGCQRDLVEDGRTGWVFRAEIPGALEKKLRQALADLDSAKGKIICAAARKRISEYSYDATTAGLQRAMRLILTERAGVKSAVPLAL